MKIVIAGAGEVGSHLAKMLSGGTHEITVIDPDQNLLDEVTDFSDVVTIAGDPTTFEVLRKAGIRKTDLFIGVSTDENINIISCIIAKQSGARKTIARIDNGEYLEDANREVFIGIGIDFLFYPEKLAAEEVINLLGHSSTTDYMDFSDGKLSLVVLRLDGSSPLIGRTLYEAGGETVKLEFRTVAISRAMNTIIPRGDDVFADGDTVYVITETRSAEQVAQLAGKENIQVRNVMIFGGSRIGVQIAAALQNRISVKLVEYNDEKANRLANQLDKTLIINEDGRNIEAMIEEGIGGMDAFIAVTGRSETNILAAVVARKMGVAKVIAEVENFNYINLAANMGIDTIINKKLVTAGTIYRFTSASDVQSVKMLTGSDAEVVEYIVKPDAPLTRAPLRRIDFPQDAIIGGVVRGDQVFIATGDTHIRAYDRVVVFALPGAIEKLGRFFN